VCSARAGSWCGRFKRFTPRLIIRSASRDADPHGAALDEVETGLTALIGNFPATGTRPGGVSLKFHFIADLNRSGEKESQPKQNIHTEKQEAFKPRRLAIASDRIDDQRRACDGEQM
jgi:hypothetical protein